MEIADEVSVILYAPTFRDDGSTSGYALDYEDILNAFEKKLKNKCVMIVRLHPNAQKLCSFIEYNDRIINGTNYSDIQELYFIADVLITDYSSAAFDFSLLNRPVFLCMLDFEEYTEMRGFLEMFSFYPFPKAYSNMELVKLVEKYEEANYIHRLESFKKEIWKPFDNGQASRRTVCWLKNRIERKKLNEK